MKPIIITGIALILLGVLSFAQQSTPYTNRQNAADIGPVEASFAIGNTYPLSPLLLCMASFAGGISLLVFGNKHKDGLVAGGIPHSRTVSPLIVMKKQFPYIGS